jgi:hypothetical protein
MNVHSPDASCRSGRSGMYYPFPAPKAQFEGSTQFKPEGYSIKCPWVSPAVYGRRDCTLHTVMFSQGWKQDAWDLDILQLIQARFVVCSIVDNHS